MKRIFAVATTTVATLAGAALLVSWVGSGAGEADGTTADGPARTGAATTEPSTGEQSVEDRFVGNYRLVSFESFPEEGETVDRDYVGRILYDEHGNMSAVGMPRDLPDRAARAGEGEDTPRSGFAYFGTFSVDPDEGTVTHHVRGSPMAPDWVGTDLVRYYELDGDLLMLSLKDESGRTTGTLTWQRY